jgi:hypothetical protein
MAAAQVLAEPQSRRSPHDRRHGIMHSKAGAHPCAIAVMTLAPAMACSCLGESGVMALSRRPADIIVELITGQTSDQIADAGSRS